MRQLPNLISALLGIIVLSTLLYVLWGERAADPQSTGATLPIEAGPPNQEAIKAAQAIKNASNQLGVARTDDLLTDHAVPKPLHIRSTLAPLTTISVVDLPRVDHGIQMPDGTFLPLLNGMTQAPPISREKPFGDPGPIVAKTVDSAGFEWWIHADGSTTTSKYKEVVLQDGTRYWDPASFHNAPLPKGSMVGLDRDGKAIDPANQRKR